MLRFAKTAIERLRLKFWTKKQFVPANDEYLDILSGERRKRIFWQRLTVTSLAVCTCASVSVVALSFEIVKQVDLTTFRVVSPNIRTVYRPGSLPEKYIKDIATEIAELNSSWTFENVRENYQRLFDRFYDFDLKVKTEANLISTSRFEFVEKHKIISTFRVIPEKTKAEWCQILDLGCALVTGEQKQYVEGNVVNTQEVSYLILVENVEPTPINMFAARAKRVLVGDYEKHAKILEEARKGFLPPEENEKIVRK